jgi:hypothetical protein
VAPLLLAANFDPVGVYRGFAVLGVVAVGVVYLATRSLAAAAFWAVFPLAVIYSRWAWNPNTIPLFAALSLWAVLRRRHFLAGFFWGLAGQLHITALALSGPLVFLIMRGEEKKRALLLLVWGLILGIFPMIIFDLRHEGLYLNSYLALGAAEAGVRGWQGHYFLWAGPFLAAAVGRLPRPLAAGVILISAGVSLQWLASQKVDAAVHPRTVRGAAEIIARDVAARNRPFNVASFVDPVARATAYRYFLELSGNRPLGVEEYPRAQDLYVITFEKGEKVLYNQTYEVASFGPKKIGREWAIGGEYLYRLER